MKLRRLRIENFKRLREPCTFEGFDDGINLFAAPNEAGKSTVAEAIRAAFFERHRSGSVEHLRPWDAPTATPTVELEFDIGTTRYRLSKAFLGRKRCELLIDGQAPLDGAAAEDHLASLLGFGFAGKGANTPEHMGIPGLLWVRQGTSHELAEAVTHASDQLRQVLAESLGELTSSSGDTLLRSVELARNELLTPSTGSPRGEFAAGLQRQDALAGKLAALDADIAAYQASVDRLAALRREHQRDGLAPPWLDAREQERKAQARLAVAQGLTARQDTAQAALRQWQTQAAALRSELEALARDDAAVLARQHVLAQKEEAERVAQVEARAWERQRGEALAADAKARHDLERVRAISARADLVRNLVQAESALAATSNALDRARSESTRAAQLQGEAGTLQIAPADLEQLKQLSDSLREVVVRLEATATVLEFDLVDGKPVRLGEEPIQGQARRTIVSRTEIRIDGIGSIAVQPGGIDVPALTAQRDQLTAAQAELLQKLRVASVAAAEERARLAAQRLHEAQAIRQLLAVLAPKGVQAMEAELAALTVQRDELRATLAALAPAPAPATEGDGELPALASVQAEAARAASTLENATAALGGASVAAAKAQSELETARQELTAAQATVNNPQRAERLPAAQRALVDAAAQEAAAQRQVDEVEVELRELNLPLLQQDLERFARSARQLQEAHERRRQDITRLEVELETKGAMGLEEQRAEVQRELESASRRAGELERHAAALDHLLNLLKGKRSALALRLRAPLQQHLDHYLGILFPRANMPVADDLSPGNLTRTGPRGPESGGFEELSVGTREQVGIITRLAYADLLQAAGRPTLLILDDALVNSDDQRLEQMKRVLYDAAQRHQLFIFTCHPESWQDLGVAARPIPPLPSS